MIIYALIVGFVITIQGGLNKQISESSGLAFTLVWMSLVVLIFSSLFYMGVKLNWIAVPDFIYSKSMNQKLNWMVILTGLCGFIIILGLPWLIIKIGATKTIVVAIAGQIISSFLWDWLVEKNPANTLRLVGSLVTFIGAVIVSIS